jgi:phosphoribosylformylglycinamidine cyclo-ligase
MSKSIYEQLGVDPSKSSVREIFEKVVDNEYPGAFVNIVTDPYCPDRALTMHQDGDGSKFVQRFLHYFESGDERIFAGMVDDALAMNTGDIAASGFVFGPWVITDILNVNLPPDLKKTVIRVVASRMLELMDLYHQHGFEISFLGGETADLPDQVRSGVFDIGITAWADKKDLITGNVQNGDLIFGFSSDGRAVWEDQENSGIMSNGLTMARSELMSGDYNEKYPSLKREGSFYKGTFHYDDRLPEFNGISVSEAILSPTRQWPLLIRRIISLLKEANALYMLHGISMNTGGGATKVKNVGRGGIMYVKNMPTPPPIFRLIQKVSNESWENMYQSFNCGMGIDIVGLDHPVFVDILEKAALECELFLHTLGICHDSPYLEHGENKLSLNTPYGLFRY